MASSSILGDTHSAILKALQDQSQAQQSAQAAQAPIDSLQQQAGNSTAQGMAMQQQQPATPNLPGGQQQQATYSGGIGGQVKGMLTNFFYGMGQSMMKDVGLPTDYEKQQQSTLNLQRQQQIDQTGQQIQSGIQEHQQLMQQQQYEMQPVNLPTPIAQALGMPSVARKDFPSAIQAYAGIQQNSPTIIAPAGLEKFGVPEGSLLAPKQLGNITKLNSLLNSGWVTSAVNGQTVLLNKATGDMKVVGPDEKVLLMNLQNQGRLAAANVNASTRLATSVQSVIDPETGNPTIIPTSQSYGMTPTGRTNGEQALVGPVGLHTYQASLANIRSNLGALDDPQQRALAAKALQQIGSNHDPGFIQSTLNGMVQSGLNGNTATLIAGVLQARESAAGLRKYIGNPNGTEALMQRIAANIAAPGNNRAVNEALLTNDEATVKRALDAVQNTRRPGRGGATPQSAPQQQQTGGGGNDPFAQFGGKRR